ncbi:response regulator [Promicromonospora sp. NPDC052451]|uniref:response regulator n=1 Tax=Promicromonospora sp. NPDC052451 TaxID=3364407 RepID=UPI0037C92B04
MNSEPGDEGTRPPSGNRVLVVDDDVALVRALAINLRAHGWDVTTAPTGAAALDAVASARPEVVLLDLGLPDMPGLEVIAGIRGWTRVPIVVLSARQLGDDKVDALDAGADDYVTKPFVMNELLARLRAAVRRAAPAQAEEPVVVAGELRIDLARRQVFRAGAEVRLSPTEWALLEVLVRNRGRLVDRKLLLHEVWGPAYSTETNYLRVYTAQLRRKLERDPSHPQHILTHPGAGYRFEVEPAGPGPAPGS